MGAAKTVWLRRIRAGMGIYACTRGGVRPLKGGNENGWPRRGAAYFRVWLNLNWKIKQTTALQRRKHPYLDKLFARNFGVLTNEFRAPTFFCLPAEVGRADNQRVQNFLARVNGLRTR